MPAGKPGGNRSLQSQATSLRRTPGATNARTHFPSRRHGRPAVRPLPRPGRPARQERDLYALVTAARALRHQYPDADPQLVVRVVVETRDGLAAFGYRAIERTAGLITEVAAKDPRLMMRRAADDTRRSDVG